MKKITTIDVREVAPVHIINNGAYAVFADRMEAPRTSLDCKAWADHWRMRAAEWMSIHDHYAKGESRYLAFYKAQAAQCNALADDLSRG